MGQETNTEIKDHRSGDHLISSLLMVGGRVEDFLKVYPGSQIASDDDSWIHDWFEDRIGYFLGDDSAKPEDLSLRDDFNTDALRVEEEIVSVPSRLLSVQPNYFRGFRRLDRPIDLSPNLVVLEGKNSSGKTSLTEALEWLFSGELVRRKMQSQGDPKELEKCITNELIPDGEECWVSAHLEREDGTHIELKRVLVSDYGATSTSVPKWKLILDGNEISEDKEASLLSDLFAGVPPLLMQHSLRSFVLSSASQRRGYFEKLLSLDEVTYLIEKAVVGKTEAASFVSANGNRPLNEYLELIGKCTQKKSKTILRRGPRSKKADPTDILLGGLIKTAVLEFPDLTEEEQDMGAIVTSLRAKQSEKRQEVLPILGQLRPNRVVDEELKRILTEIDFVGQLSVAIKEAEVFETASRAAKDIDDEKLAIAQSYSRLMDAKLIDPSVDSQTCPLCAYEEVPTLLSDRLKDIESWVPLQKATSDAYIALSKAIDELRNSLEKVQSIMDLLVPPAIETEEWDDIVKGADKAFEDSLGTFRGKHETLVQSLMPLDMSIRASLEILAREPITKEVLEAGNEAIGYVGGAVARLLESGKAYALAFEDLENIVGVATAEDPQYSLRALWLSSAGAIKAIADDIRFEQAKSKARKELACIRDYLIEARQDYLDLRRSSFSDSMDHVWNELRSDRYSAFRKLHIPEPSGKGFPVSIEVKAIIDDGTQELEVDALKVFSESQVNVVGIAAFITRSKMLGHRTIILDDPVQSMDEDHFKTFASRLIPYLMSEGFHVIVLTHNDQFAKDISHYCIDIDGYTTMRITHSRRTGCRVEEGNRRVAERLRRAEKEVDDGEFDEAWKFIRLAIERLYLATCLTHGGDDFDPLSFTGQGAESMWNKGAGEIISKLIPDAPARLKDILDMAATGVHDASSSGETDLRLAISDIRSYLNPLRIGG